MAKSGVVTAERTKRVAPHFFENRGNKNWKLTVYTDEGPKEFVGIDYRIESQFGHVVNVVQTDENGNPLFDHPVYHEAPGTIVVAWGRDIFVEGHIRIAVVAEERPHVTVPEDQKTIPSEPIKFFHLPMGFSEKLENEKKTGVRELKHETGTLRDAIIKIEKPDCPFLNGSPALLSSWNDIVFIEVDLDKIKELKALKEKAEPIVKAEYMPIKELMSLIMWGGQMWDDGDILFRDGLSLAALMIFFATKPQLWRW
ncbi:MAG: hypothetical protein HY764_03165 [Candidatus Portnoybacteria bacterium]|nr:hypothetical protein [Candidatus Portnoybacteria bacterium]